jgi:hypothetical protein
MGRYYGGDIEGKFLFQPSNDADFFGAESYQQLLSYEFCEDNMEDFESGIQKCLDALGEHKDKLDKFFEGNDSYNYDSIAVVLFGTEKAEDVGDGSQITGILEWYARLQLGVKIRDCVTENGSCSFTAEL